MAAFVVRWLVLLHVMVAAEMPEGPWSKWNYCGDEPNADVRCKDKGTVHTVCKRGHKCDPEPDCMEHTTDKFRDLMVKLHNEKRNFVAMGKHQRPSVPGSSNMRALSYDYSLEYTIRCHLNVCQGTEHDECRGTKSWVQCSQNLCGHTIWDDKKNLDENIESLAALCVDLWFNESYYDGADFTQVLQKYDSLDVPQGKTGHFTALVWGITSHLGCHFSRDTVEKPHAEMGSGDNTGLYAFVGCNYGLGGNNEGRPMYRVGKPCSRCPRGITCNSEYPGLCGNIKYTADLKGGSLSKIIWVSVIALVAVGVLGVAGFLIWKFAISGGDDDDDDED